MLIADLDFGFNPDGLKRVLRASFARRQVLYSGEICDVIAIHKLSEEKINAITEVFEDRVRSSSVTHQYAVGFFNPKTYKVRRIDEKFELTVEFLDGKTQCVYLEIKSQQAPNLKALSSVEQLEWFESNADVIEENSTCIII